MKEEPELEEGMSRAAKTTMKHVSNPTAGEKKAAKDIKPGIAGYRDRIAMLKSAEQRGALKKEEVEGVSEGFADDFLAMARQKNPNARIVTADQKKKETDELMKKRATSTKSAPKSGVPADKYPLGGYDPKSNKSYSEEVKMNKNYIVQDTSGEVVYSSLDESDARRTAEKLVIETGKRHFVSIVPEFQYEELDKLTEEELNELSPELLSRYRKAKGNQRIHWVNPVVHDTPEKKAKVQAHNDNITKKVGQALGKEMAAHRKRLGVDINYRKIKNEEVEEVEEGWDDMLKAAKSRVDAPAQKTSTKTFHDVKKTSTGTVYTKQSDTEGISKGTGEDAAKAAEPKVKRGRGRPVGSKSGARQTGSASKTDYRGFVDHTLNLPTRK